MKNNTMIPYNPKKDLETNYYNKTEVELLVAGGSGGSIDLSNYYKKLETYSKAQVDALVAGGGADLSDYYTKAEVDGLLDSISLDDYYTKTQTEVLLSNKVEKEDGKGLSTNDFTNTFKQAYDGHLASTSNPHNVTALQVGAYSKSENDNLLIKKANLDINNKIPLSEIPDSILGQLKYMGVWDFSSGFPTGAEKGNYWITSVSGNGYEVGDWAVYNSTSFDKVDNTDAISSVAGRTGNVVLNKNDVGLNNVDNTSDLNKPISTATQTALDTKQDNLVSGTSIKTINGQSVLGNGDIEITGGASLTNYYDKTQTDTLLSNKVDKVTGKGLSTNDFTNTFKQALELKKVQDISTDSVNKKLIVNYTDATVANLNINDIITDVHVSGATLDATTNVLTLTSTDGGANVTVDLSDFVNSSELTTALAGKVSKIVSTDDAIVAFSGTTGEVKNTNLTKTDLDTYIGKAGTIRVSTNLKTIGITPINWIGGIVPTTKAGTTTVTGLIGAVAGTWNKIGDSTTLLTTAKTTIVEAINELFNGKVSKIGADDIEVTLATKGVILKSPNGTRYKITVNDDGSLQTTGV